MRTTAAATDRELVEAIAGGDHAAFADLYARMASLMFGTALRVLTDRTLAEDATHEAFIEVWKHAGRFDAEHGSVRTWLVMLTHRRAVDRVRNEQARTNRQLASGAVPVAPAPAADVTALAADERTSIGIAMSALTDGQRESIELAFYGGLTHVQIAARLAVPLGTIKSRINSGLRCLRATLTSTPREGSAEVSTPRDRGPATCAQPR